MESTGFTPTIQQLMILCDKNGFISFHHQEIVKHTSSFYRAMSFLKRNGFIKPVCSVCNKTIRENGLGMCDSTDIKHKKGDKHFRHYSLTLTGEIVTMMLKKLH